jgi:Flp pilus assembly protein CpaB
MTAPQQQRRLDFMKRRNWIWFVASALLAVLAGVLAMVLLGGGGGILGGAEATPVAMQSVVVARAPIATNDVIRVDYVMLEDKPISEVPSGAFVSVTDLTEKNAVALRDIAQGEIITADAVYIASPGEGESVYGDKVGVALPAQDILSKWGAVLPGDHVDVLFSMDVILETPMYVEDIRTLEELQLYAIERDQSLDKVSVLALQDLTVLRIIEEPAPEGQEDEEQPIVRNRALELLADPQDAVVLKYLLDAGGMVSLAKRSADNQSLFNVQPVNINYLMLRYGIVLPQPLE